MIKKTMGRKKRLRNTVIVSVGVALCCFTPILVFLFSIIGLSILIPYLDYVLLPALGVTLLITALSYYNYRQGVCSPHVVINSNNKNNIYGMQKDVHIKKIIMRKKRGIIAGVLATLLGVAHVTHLPLLLLAFFGFVSAGLAESIWFKILAVVVSLVSVTVFIWYKRGCDKQKFYKEDISNK